MNLISIVQLFPTQDACIEYLEKVRWGGKPVCPYCGESRSSTMMTEDRHRHHCNACNKSFKVTVDTILHGTHLPLQKWFLAMVLILNAKKGLSALQLSRDLDVNKNTAWRMGMMIRKAMMSNQAELLSGIVEMDETYVGGKPRKGNDGNSDDENKPKRGRGTKKIAVVGMVERNGKVKAASAKGKLTSKNLSELVRESVDVDASVLITDEYRGYRKILEFMEHLTINHSHQYVDGFIHTNTIESFWALLKRGIVGQYHKVSAKHLDKYITEFAFRYNHRHAGCVFDKLVGLAMA